MKTSQAWINQLGLLPHVEGGYYKETGRSKDSMSSGRSLYSNILFLLTAESPSHFHRLDADELWYYHDGSPLSIHCIFPDGHYEKVTLGLNYEQGEVLQYCVPSGTIFGSTVAYGYGLVSCMVAPGFEYEAFELFNQQELLEQYPQHEDIIKKLTRL